MKLHEFQKESNRLCKAYRVIGCEKCPLHKCHCDTYKGLTDFAYVYDAVSAWSDSHPIKTRQSEFLKMFPNAYLETITRLLPCSLDRTLKPFRCAKYGYLSITCRCDRCRDDYWNEEVTDND